MSLMDFKRKHPKFKRYKNDT